MLGQALLARRMGKQRVIAETGAGQHGVASATAAALLGLDCVVYMGEVDMERQALNVFRMRLLGAEVRTATSGSRTLKDAINEAMRDWVASVETTHYIIGSVMGPHPYPWMVRELHRVIGDEAREQCRALVGRDPDVVTACVGGGSNAIGLFSGFAELPSVELVGVEPAGGAAVGPRRARHRPRLEVVPPAGRARAGDGGRVDLRRARLPGHRPRARPPRRRSAAPRYEKVTDDEVLDAFQVLARTEGIIAALESAHALAWVLRAREELAGKVVILNLSGRGDKDVAQVADLLGASRRWVTSDRSRRTCASGATPGRKLLVPYVTGGLGEDWPEVVRAYADAGADAIEIGIPFSDPVMDGPDHPGGVGGGAGVGRSTSRPSSTQLRGVDAGVPLVAMTYVNLVFHLGYERFAAEAVAAGISGVILPGPADGGAGRVGGDRRRRRPRDGPPRVAAHARRSARHLVRTLAGLRVRRQRPRRHR